MVESRRAGQGKSVKPNPSIGKKCQNQCVTVTEDERKLLFNEYYTFNNYDQKKSWLIGCMEEIEVKRKRTKAQNSRRKKTVQYSVVVNGTKKKVCMSFLNKTLDISQMTFRHTLANATNTNRPKPDGRGKHRPSNKTFDEQTAKVKEFIESLPVVPSHYCRKNTKRLYLSKDIGNIANLERLYAAHCKANHTTNPVKKSVLYFVIFSSFTI